MLLLDPHALLWWLADDPALSPTARTTIAAGQTQVFVSAASAWEMSIKRAQGKLDSPEDLEAELVRHRFQPLPITIAHAVVAGRLPRHHSDPFDRMLIAQAVVEDMKLLTYDLEMKRYSAECLW